MSVSAGCSAEERLQERIIQGVMPCLVRELLAHPKRPTENALADASREALLLVYQILAILHFEARGLPIPTQETTSRAKPATRRTQPARLFSILNAGTLPPAGAPYPGSLFDDHPCRQFSKKTFTEIFHALTCDQEGQAAILDYATLDVRHLGAVYEEALKASWSDGNQSVARKARGAYFTPAPIIDHILTHALGPVLDQHLKRLRPLFRAAAPDDKSLFERFFNLRLLDPALGAGYFLLAAIDYLAVRMAAFLAEFPNNPISRTLHRCGTRQKGITAFQLLRQRLLGSCIFGVDIDPLVLEVARLGLYLQCALPGQPAPVGGLRCGNALLAATFADVPACDVILGNPPYGAALDADTLTAARRQLPLLYSNADTAVGFLERSLQLVRPGGRIGFILPKPLLYSYAWRHVRSALRGRIQHLADVSRAWQDVRLEQVILVASAEPAAAVSYSVAMLGEGGFETAEPMPWTWADRFRTLPSALDANERALLGSLLLSPTTLGQLCKTFRGLPLQRELRNRGSFPILGGRDLARWQVRSCAGYLTAGPERRAAFQTPKLVFQNIIAHIRRPRSHIQLIGAYDPAGTITLDTVNNLVARQPGVDLWGILALLHSEMINWFVHTVVYSKAIRTMHFDQYFLDKIPLPPDWGKLLAQLAPLARKATRLVGKQGPRTAGRYEETLEQINRLVNDAYGASHPR